MCIRDSLDRVVDRSFAAEIHSVGEHDERLAAGLPFHDLGRGARHRVIEQRAAAALHAELAHSLAVDVGHGVVQLFDGPGERLAHLHAGIELHDEGVVDVFAEDAVEEAQAGGAFLVCLLYTSRCV